MSFSGPRNCDQPEFFPGNEQFDNVNNAMIIAAENFNFCFILVLITYFYLYSLISTGQWFFRPTPKI